jgi:multiple antibiotic resistance protein
VLNFFGVSIHALKIAGGIIISRSGFQLLNAQHKNDVQGTIEDESRLKEDISFSPLAMPLLAGPGSISLLINLAIQEETFQGKAIVFGGIFAVCFSIYLILSSAPYILLVLSIGIQMIVASGRSLFYSAI